MPLIGSFYGILIRMYFFDAEQPMNPRVKRVLPQPDHRLMLEFDNGELKVFDMKPYLDRGVFRALRDSPDFAKAEVVDGSVEWPGEIDLSFDTLYLRSQSVQGVTA